MGIFQTECVISVSLRFSVKYKLSWKFMYSFVQVEMEKYKKGVQWIRELLYQVQFTVDRLKIMATKMTNDVSQLKRNGRYVVQTLFKGIVFNKGEK